MLCDFIVIFLYGFSCFSCIFDCVNISLIENLPNFNVTTITVSDSVFFWIGAFCFFMLLYTKQCSIIKYRIFSLLFLIITFVIRFLTITNVIPENYISLVSIFIGIIPILLLIMFSNISRKSKE